MYVYNFAVLFIYAKNFEELFTLGELIGTGSFGKVYVAILKETGEKYAVKSIPKRYMAGHLEAHLVRRVQHEVDIYANLGHSLNVASMHSVFENDLAVDIAIMKHTTSMVDCAARILRGDSTLEAHDHLSEVIDQLEKARVKGRDIHKGLRRDRVMDIWRIETPNAQFVGDAVHVYSFLFTIGMFYDKITEIARIVEGMASFQRE
eukprot:gene2564-31007_t